MSRARVSAAATSAGPKLHLQNSIRSPFSRHSWNKRLSQRVGTQTPCYAKGSGREDDAAWEARKGALDAVMKDIEKQYGKGIVTVLGEEAAQAKVGMIPTGAHTLDLALGGGIPEGRIVEVYGPESSGKTTLAMHAIAEVQKRGGTAVLVDAEHAFDPVYSQKVGVDSKFFCPHSGALQRPFSPSPHLALDSPARSALSPPYLMKIHRLSMHGS